MDFRKSLLFLSLLSLLTQITVFAAPKTKTPVPKAMKVTVEPSQVPGPIKYQRVVPREVAVLKKRGRKSFFWGTFKADDGGPTRGVHIVKLSRKRKKFETRSYIFSELQLALDIYEQKNGRFKRIVRIPFSDVLSDPNSAITAAEFHWLKNTKVAPLIRLDITEPGGVGYIGSTFVIALHEGWKNVAAVHWARVGTWHASNSSGQRNSISTDDNGTALVHTSVRSFGAFDAEGNFISWDRNFGWDDTQKQFVPIKSSTPETSNEYANLPLQGRVPVEPHSKKAR